MPSYLHPGVYIEEIPSGSKPIEGVATSVAAFVGAANRGPVGAPILVGKFEDYVQTFGNIASEQDAMGLAVMAFYLNGGKAAYICRLAGAGHAAAEATFDGDDGGGGAATDLLTVTASSPGTWANQYFILISNADIAARTFDLSVGLRDSDGIFDAKESFVGLSMDSSDENFAELQINGVSGLINVSVNAPGNEAVTDTPSVDGDGNPNGEALTGDTAGNDGAALGANDYTSFYNNILRKVRDVSIMVLPGQQWAADGSGNAAISATRAHCEATKSRVLIIDPPANLELAQAATVTTMALPTSTYTALYYPWVSMANPLYNVDLNPTAAKTVLVPPSAFAAGMWTKIDGKRGVWKAPAGVEAQLTAAAGLAFEVEDLEQDQLNPLGINCFRKLPSFGSVIWGARTLATKADPEWRYVPVRRTAIFIEQSIYNGIQWAVFEPNDHPLWGALRANIGAFMNGLFRAGAFQGAKASDAFFVRCGLGDTMTQGDIDRGQVIVIVGFAPLKPAEFVIVRIQQKVGQQ
ncbi:phage tail sheath subtilisin-like domain-containing protein [Aliiglaciecola sp. CAU 1673]|uniref:phage tail sheath family protein n=1 Tax=Aliiglaciecola sp. CAU 1673 TaxID=3032595 RepID=UPI0023DC2E07|nr:phage tail sheath subtilisin-like domain-containing protein [Aliiglaciecola sp. CAU 1673]MDF2177345.1 phage tail sheath subtilisin-like domain-containing protein [Aliiglaciecola sp. CAU 1673]